MDAESSSLFATPKATSTPATPSIATSSSQFHRSRRTPPSSSRQSHKGNSQGGSRTFRKLSFGSGGELDQGGASFEGFTFSPSFSTTTTEAKSALDLGSLNTSLSSISREIPKEDSPRRIARLRLRRTAQRNKRRTTLNDLPDELLLKIFTNLDDQQGFRPLERSSSKGPSWLFPPLRVALVCKRWLPIAQSLFYRSIKIHHLERIPSLHHTFSTTNLSLAVRYLSIALPYKSLGKLSLPSTLPPSTNAALSSTREPDSDTDASNHGSRQGKKKARGPLSNQDQLRTIFQSCSHLLSLEIAGIDPLVLFSSSSTASPSLHHLHRLRLSTIASLSLGGSSSPVLTSTTLRQALLALTGLRTLALKGYVSNPSSPLEFAPTTTIKGSPARPLPSRAQMLLKLRSIAILDSAMNSSDLESLLKQVQTGSIEELVVTDFYDGKLSLERIREGRYGGTTIEGLSSSRVGDLVKGSLKVLRVTLHNFPLARDAISAAQSSPPPATHRRLSGVNHPPTDPPHILDTFISNLQVIETLDVGGSLVTSSLLLPLSPAPAPTLLPSTVKHLIIRASPALNPNVVLTFLQNIARNRQQSTSSFPSPLSIRRTSAPHHSTFPNPPQLKALEVFGGSESGWKSGVLSWQIQKTCWDIGVEWRGLGEWKPRVGGGDWRLGATGGQSTW